MKQQKKSEAGIYNDFIRIGISFLIALIVCFFVSSYVIQKTDVEGKSMEPALKKGDLLLIDKLFLNLKEPKRYDIVVFPAKNKKSVYYIKRIIGLPGEKIQIIGDSIYINNRILDESYGKEAMEEQTEGIALRPIVLKENEYFVLGDNRNHSIDSRNKEIGVIKKEALIGQAFFNLRTFSKVS